MKADWLNTQRALFNWSLQITCAFEYGVVCTWFDSKTYMNEWRSNSYRFPYNKKEQRLSAHALILQTKDRDVS